jgi:hypothetical protein
MHQQMPAMWRGRDLFHEQLLQSVARAAIGECEIQRTLHLPAELARLALGLPAVRPMTRRRAIERRGKIRIHESRRRAPPAVMAKFQDKAPLRGRQASAQAAAYAQAYVSDQSIQ